jgi:hypothetical protein
MFLTQLTRLWVCADGYIAGFRIIKSSSARGTAHDRFQLWLRAQHSSDTTGQPLGKQAWDGMRSVQRSKDIPLPPHFSAEHRMMGSCEQVLAWLWGYSWMHISHVPSKYQGPCKVAKGFRVLRVTCSWYLSGQGHAASSPSISLGCLALPCLALPWANRHNAAGETGGQRLLEDHCRNERAPKGFRLLNRRCNLCCKWHPLSTRGLALHRMY